jgi:hypothetical protein
MCSFSADLYDPERQRVEELVRDYDSEDLRVLWDVFDHVMPMQLAVQLRGERGKSGFLHGTKWARSLHKMHRVHKGPDG